MSAAARSHQELLELARVVLEEAGFDVNPSESLEEGFEAFFAEDRLFVLLVAAVSAISDVPFLEAAAAKHLRSRLALGRLGGKRWDVYLAVLVAEPRADLAPQSRDLFDVNYDVRDFRRLVVIGVKSTLGDVEAALRSFLPLPEATGSDVSADILHVLEQELLSRGQPAALVQRAVAAYRQSKDLSSV